MSEIQPDHPALVPFSQLDPKTKEEDRPYMEAVRLAAAQD